MRVRKLTEVRAWDVLPELLYKYVKKMSTETGLKIRKCASPEEAVRGADIIVTATRARSGPIVGGEWVQPGTHIVAIGADIPGKQELDVDIFVRVKVVCDSIELCTENGKIKNALKAGTLRPEDIHAEIGEIILGNKPGREIPGEATIFDAVGMAIRDIGTTAMLNKRVL